MLLGRKSNGQKYCSKILAQDMKNWTLYHGLILLMIIKFSSMENQSKRRKERKKSKFYFIDNHPGCLYAHVERRIFEVVPMI